MTGVSESGFAVTGKTTFICDYSPPRSGILADAPSTLTGADFLLVNRNPGHSVRADSAMLAAALKERTGMEVIFALLTRDMNRLALQSYLLGAQMLGLENLVVAQGDPFPESDATRVSAVNDYQPTRLIADIAEMNQGRDFRGRPLLAATGFCVGATLDPSADLYRQVVLVERKIRAGAQFLISQPIFDARIATRFEDAYTERIGGACPTPIYWGLQMLEKGSVSFGTVPGKTQRELEAGRSGLEIALEVLENLEAISCRNIYLVPSILKGGERGYVGAQQFMEAVRERENRGLA